MTWADLVTLGTFAGIIGPGLGVLLNFYIRRQRLRDKASIDAAKQPIETASLAQGMSVAAAQQWKELAAGIRDQLTDVKDQLGEAQTEVAELREELGKAIDDARRARRERDAAYDVLDRHRIPRPIGAAS